MNDKSTLQQIFASYADCEFLNGEAVKDDDGTELQTAVWLCENRFDDSLDEISYALVAAGVSRDALMRVFPVTPYGFSMRTQIRSMPDYCVRTGFQRILRQLWAIRHPVLASRR